MKIQKAMESLGSKISQAQIKQPKEELKRPIGKHSNGLGVKMSNALISATHDLNLNERRLIYLAMASLKNGNEISVNAKAFAETFKTSEKNTYAYIKDACNKLFEREIKFNDGRKIGRARWVQEAVYHEGEGWCSIKFTDLVKANLKGLQSQYTKYSLEQAGNLKSIYSWRILERLIQYGDAKKHYKGWWELSVIELTEFLQLSDFYHEWRQLKQKILTPACQELEQKDGWQVEIIQIKTGRKVTHVRFEFKQNPQGKLDI